MTAVNYRWLVVALGLVVLVAVPAAVRARPVGDAGVDATTLLERVRAGDDLPVSGYVETTGTLALPSASRFSSVGALFGETTRLRVWWRDDEHWRVARLRTTGEESLVHVDGRTTAYDYEDAAAEASVDPDIRLPRTADLLPHQLTRRLLPGVGTDDVGPIEGRRVAGVAAAGLRVRPPSPRSSIDHVDLWADPETGRPLRVEVYARGSRTPDLSSGFLDVEQQTPPAEEVAPALSAATEVSFEDVLDIADAANQYAPLRPPPRVAGLAASDSSDGAVGVYGRGATQLIAIPIRGREAGPLRAQVVRSPGARLTTVGATATFGPLTVVLTGEDDDGGWLVAGTVTPETAERAGADLLAGSVYLED